MPWYYANNNHRLGPVSDSEFARLAREKIIIDETLVWRHGMADWKTYAEVVSTLPPPELTVPPPELTQPVTSAPAPTAAPQAEVLPIAVSLNYAGFWIRLAAKLVDWVALFVVSRQIASLMGLANLDPVTIMQADMATLGPLAQRLAWMGLLDGAARLAYYWYFLARFSATPGKLLFRLRVVSADGSPLSNGQIVGRFFSEVLTKYFTLCIGYVVAGFDPEKRTMHDHFCNTRVIRRDGENGR